MNNNGKLKPNKLSPISGGGRLRNDAARSWNAFANMMKKKHGFNVQVTDSYRPLGKPGDASRGVWSQWAAWEKYQAGGNLAARPGTSNHGFGTALDLPPATVDAVRKYGDAFGWNHAHTDAPSESWHHLFLPSQAHKDVIARWSTDPVIKQGSKGPATKTLKTLLKKHGYWPTVFPIVEGFGSRTTAQVKKFQKAYGLRPDGFVGLSSWKALRGPVKLVAKPKPPVKPPAPKPKPPTPVKNPNAKYFADIFNGTAQFDAVKYKAAGHSLIVLKASEGKTFKDQTYVDRVKAARSAGLTVFSYHFARPSTNKPEDEAKNFCDIVKKAGTKPTDRLVLDWEDPKFIQNGDVWIEKFINAVAKQGLTVRIIYSGGWYLPDTMKKWPKDQSGVPLRYWHAEYSSKPESGVPDIAKAHLWAVQFTDGENGSQPKSCAGIGKCDVNYLK